MRAPADGYTLVMAPGNAINATLYDKLNFNFVRDIAPVAGFIRSPCHGATSIGSSQDRTRIDRLCQSQSGQDQYGVSGNGTVRIWRASCSR